MIPAGAWLEGTCTGCGAGWRCPASDAARPACAACGREGEPFHPEMADESGGLRGCLACGHDEMYWARDFPKRVGIAVVVAAAVLAPFTMYISLAVGAVVDALLVFTVRKRLHCYRCGAIHHGFDGAALWQPFDLEVADVHRYGEKAAVAQTLGAGHALPHARRRDAQPEESGRASR